jgi:hypothetical protein
VLVIGGELDGYFIIGDEDEVGSAPAGLTRLHPRGGVKSRVGNWMVWFFYSR